MAVPPPGPGVPKALPVIGGFVLEAVPPALLEQAVLIADAVTVQRQIHGSGGIQKTGGQPSKTAVAQGAVFDLFKHVDIQAVVGKGLFDLFQNAQIVEVVVYHPAGKILRRKIISAPVPFVGMAAFVPVVGDAVHDHPAQSVVDLIYGGLLKRDLILLL